MGSRTSVCAIEPDAAIREIGKKICLSGVSDLTLSLSSIRAKFTATNRTNTDLQFTLTYLDACDTQPATLKVGESATIRVTRSGLISKSKAETSTSTNVPADTIKTLAKLIDIGPNISWFNIECTPKSRESRHDDSLLEVVASCFVFNDCELPCVNREAEQHFLVDRKRTFSRGYHEFTAQIVGSRVSMVSSRLLSRSVFSESLHAFAKAESNNCDVLRQTVQTLSQFTVNELDKRDPRYTEEQLLISGVNRLLFAFYSANFTKVLLSAQRGFVFVDTYNLTGELIRVSCSSVHSLQLEFQPYERVTMCIQCDMPQGDLFVIDECRSPVKVGLKGVDLKPFCYLEEWVAGVEEIFNAECVDLLLEANARYVNLAARFRAAFDLTLPYSHQNFHIQQPNVGSSSRSTSFACCVRCDGLALRDDLLLPLPCSTQSQSNPNNLPLATPVSFGHNMFSSPSTMMKETTVVVIPSGLPSCSNPSLKTVTFVIDGVTYTLTHRGLYSFDVNVLDRFCVGNNTSPLDTATVCMEKNMWRIPPRQHFKVTFPASTSPVMNIRALQPHDIDQ